MLTTNVEDEIRLRAYELYQQRGNATGNEREDWLTAEHEVNGHFKPKENTMKAHEKRFIIEVESFVGGKNKWVRSIKQGLGGFYATREEAVVVLDKGEKSNFLKYRVRMK